MTSNPTPPVMGMISFNSRTTSTQCMNEYRTYGEGITASGVRGNDRVDQYVTFTITSPGTYYIWMVYAYRSVENATRALKVTLDGTTVYSLGNSGISSWSGKSYTFDIGQGQTGTVYFRLKAGNDNNHMMCGYVLKIHN